MTSDRWIGLDKFHHLCHAMAEVVNLIREQSGLPTGPVTVTAVGSAAILPWLSEVGEEAAWRSKDVDFLGETEAIAEAADVLGEGSQFWETHRVYAESLPPEVFAAPEDWPTRARVYANPHYAPIARGHRIRVPAPLDLVTAKLLRGDEVDWTFAETCERRLGTSWGALRDSLRRVSAERPDPDDVAHAERAMAKIQGRYLA